MNTAIMTLRRADAYDGFAPAHFNTTPEDLIRSAWFWLQLPLFLLLLPIYEMAVFTTTGKQWFIDKVQDVAPSSNAKQEYQGWGTGATAEAVGNTALATEAAEARALGVLSQPAADTDRLVATQTATSGKTITEIGRFNQLAVGGIMQQRALFTGLPLLTNDRIEGTQDLQQT